MALHTYTFTQLQTAINHALGGTPSADTTAADIVHDALSWLCDYFPWTWLRKSMSLSLTSAQSYVALPVDWKQFQAAIRASTFNRMVPVTLEDIAALRANAIVTSTFDLYYAISITTQASATAAPIYRLEIFPTPTSTTANAITGTYLRIIPKMSGGTDVPDIPPPWHPALKSLCRAMAVSDQFQDENPDWMRAKGLLDSLVVVDGIGQGSLGRMRGAVGGMRAYDENSPRNLTGTITTP